VSYLLKSLTACHSLRGDLLYLWVLKLSTLLDVHGASSGCGWRRRLPDVQGSCEYVGINTMLSGSLVTVTWNVLRLRMVAPASRYGGGGEAVNKLVLIPS
jgi:hypothetical protein